MISFEEFEQRASRYNVIPLARTMLADMHTPVSVYMTLRQEVSGSFLFESVEPNERIGRYSIIGIDPSVLIRARGQEVTIRERTITTARKGSIFKVLEELTSRYRQPADLVDDGFTGGFVGYLAYDTVQHLERLSLPVPAPDDVDDAILGLFETFVRFDHGAQIVTIVTNVIINLNVPLRQQYGEGKARLDALELRLRSVKVSASNFRCDGGPQFPVEGKSQYCETVERAKHYIFEGDIFQVVLSRAVTLPYAGDPFPVYRALRIINPSPYLFFVDWGDTKLIGSSPEVLVRGAKGVAHVFPIAGTRRRGKTEKEDGVLEADLLQDAKELAEHVMLVDLGRNDLGRVCELGSVKVPLFKRVERYSHVMHLVSEVKGELRKDASNVDVLKACFPAGTVSGAPKVRAMEIISELEQKRRGIYAGAVGYLGFDGSVNMCIAIRTIVAHRGTLSVQAGAGIVADSDAEREYQETVNKAQALLDSIFLASRGLNLEPHGKE